MIYILIIYGIVSLISYVATAAILGKFEKGGEKNERENCRDTCKKRRRYARCFICW